jgi:enoyl-CoA hydratase/carnithine racemase
LSLAKTVQAAASSGVLSVFLDRPERLNAVNAELVEDLLDAIKQAERADDIRAVVLAGRGRAFCAGHDLKEDLSGETTSEATLRLGRLQDITRAIRGLDVPVVAAVHGHAIGAGAEFLLACDLVVAASDTRFRFPEVSLGLSVTNGATRLLPALVGPLRAKQMIMLGDAIDARTALTMGLVNEVVAADEVLPLAQAWAQRLATQPPVALAMAKQALNDGWDGWLETALALEVEHALRTAHTGERA